MKMMTFDKCPQALEIALAPCRIDHEVAGHAVVQSPRHLDPERGLIDRRVLVEADEPLVGRRLKTEEDIEFACQRPPRLEKLGMAGDQIHAALHEYPPFADSAAPELMRQRKAPGRMVPEQIVGDEDVIAHGGEVAADGVNRPFAHRTGVQLPDRTERAAERTAPRRLDQPDGTMGEARVLAAPRGHLVSRGQGDRIQRKVAGLALRARVSALAVRQREPRHRRQRLPAFECRAQSRHHAFTLVDHDRGHVARQKWTWIRGRRVPANNDGHVRRERADLCGQCQHVVGFECVHRGNADERRSRLAQLVLERSTEAEVGERDAMAAGFEGRGDVLHAKRLDAKEGTQAEPLVIRNGTQQENVHARGARVTREGGCYTAFPAVIVASLVTVVVATAYRRRTLIIAALVVVLGLSAAGARRVEFDADVLSLLPRDGRVIPAFRQYLSSFGSVDHLYVVFTAPANHGVAEYAEEIDDWVDRLRRAPELTQVDAGVADGTRNFSWLHDRELLLLGGKPLDAALERLSDSGIPAAVASRRELLALPSSQMADLIRHDPLGLTEIVSDALGSAAPGLGASVARRGYLSDDGRSRLVIAQPARPPYDSRFSHALDARLQAIGAAVDAGEESRAADLDEPLPPLQVEFAGGHRIAVETEAVVRRESIFNTVGSLALILPLLFFTFRSLWLVLVGALPSALSLLVVLGILGFAGATLSAAAAGSAAMLFGLGIDGVVLLYAAHRLAVDDRHAG